MKKLLLSILITLLIAPFCFAGDGDITIAEVKPDVVKWVLYEVHFLSTQKIVNVDYEKQDSNGNRIGEKRIVFADVEDDINTPEDETLTEYSDLISALNASSNIRNTIKNAVKQKLSITE